MHQIPFRLSIMLVAGCLAGGCLLNPVDPKATPATAVDPKLAQSEYWFNQPATEHVEAANYDVLWSACEQAAINSAFTIERTDYRTGFMTTKPLVSKQFFEVWKHDVVDPGSQLDSDTTTRRRVVHFEIHKINDRKFSCEPKAVVEHFSMVERRVTSIDQYRDVFSLRRQLQEERTDEGTAVRVAYWYAERRDKALEKALADRIRASVEAIAESK